MKLCDAHCHYHFPALQPLLAQWEPDARTAGLTGAVVNGTSESDWEAVAAFVENHPWCRAAYGIHPWQAPQRSLHWESRLHARLAADSCASVGEIGLDAWVEGHDPEDQARLLRRQWAIALEHRRPVTVHCVRAWETLRKVLKVLGHYPAGFLLHAYNGPPDWIPWLVERGASFSFSPYFLLDRKRPQREAFRQMPADRVLIETDAPELSPPPEHNPWPLTQAGTNQPLNHPANLRTALTALAAVLEQSEETMATLTTQNWERLFGVSSSGQIPVGLE
jgi:TatD DNase family protein